MRLFGRVALCRVCVRDSRAESTAGECCSFSKRLCACDVFVF